MDVASLLQAPQMVADGISNELNTNGFIDLSGIDRQAPQSVVNNVVQLANQLQFAVDELWPSRFGSRYKSVKVLLASWDADDLGVIKEVRALEHVFADFYQYEVSSYIIPRHHPDRALTRRVIKLVDSAKTDTLLIFYYAGHASMNPNRHESIIWSANRERDSPTLTSNGIQALLEAADCDALLLYDCCHSADTAIAPAQCSRGSTELIAACGFEGIAAEVGEHSFTNALIEALALSSSGPPFSVSQLHGRVIQQLRVWKPSPTRDESGMFVRDAHGRLMMDPQRRRTPVYCNLTHGSCQTYITLSSRPPITDSVASPLGDGCTFSVETVSMATVSSQPLKANDTALSREMVARTREMIMTVKLAEEVVNGQQTPSLDAWVQWVRSAPTEADRIEINVAESRSCQSEDDQNESLLASVERDDNQTDIASYATAMLSANMTCLDSRQHEAIPSSAAPWSDVVLGHMPSLQSAVAETGTNEAIMLGSPWRQVPPSECHRRDPWSQAEDAYLVQLVHTQGALNWVRISQLIGSRSPKQCRERYHQNLKPSLNHEPISPEEGLQIERLVGEMGKRWAEIARQLRGRSDNAVKDWWNGSMNRRRKLVVRSLTSASQGSRDQLDIPLPQWYVAGTDGVVQVEG